MILATHVVQALALFGIVRSLRQAQQPLLLGGHFLILYVQLLIQPPLLLWLANSSLRRGHASSVRRGTH
jgi:hypothetical protein